MHKITMLSFIHSATAQMIQDGVTDLHCLFSKTHIDLRPLERKCSILPADIRKQPGMTYRREAFWSSLAVTTTTEWSRKVDES